jgi:hypothetical protein
MTSRHVSTQGEYPFIPGSAAAGLEVVNSVLDLFVVVRGTPTGSAAPVANPTVILLSTAVGATDMTLSFRATERNGEYWDFDIVIPNANVPDVTSQVQSNSTEVYAVAIYDTTRLADNFIATPGINAIVEYSRTEWQTEAIESIEFENITRCNSVEDEMTTVSVQIINAADPNPTIRLADGYNTELSFEGNQLTLTAGIGLGEGPAPDYGNTDPVGCPEVDPSEIDGVFVINGLLPENGNIDLSTSSGLYFNKTAGQIQVLKRTD